MEPALTARQHTLRVIGLMAIAAGILVTLAVRTDLIYADGLRYIDQAGRISRGALTEGLFRSIDHPGYPLAIAAVHALLQGEEPLGLATSGPGGRGAGRRAAGRAALSR